MFDLTLSFGAPLVASVVHTIFGILMFFTALFLILLVLIQRGRGGGLSGAFGGAGGQSAFGTKAGDTFTRITIGAATFWILLCISAILMLGGDQSVFGNAAKPATGLGRVVDDDLDGAGLDAAAIGKEGSTLGDSSAANDSVPASPVESDVPAGSPDSTSGDSGG